MKHTLAALLLFAAAAASAEEKRLLVSSAFGDPSLVAPVVRYDVDRGDGTTYAVGLSGWTIDGEWNRRLSESRALRFTADATPLNAHNSNLIYTNGTRDEALEYENAAYRVRGGMRFTPGARSTTDVLLVALYEDVSNLPLAVAQRWSSPYAGVEVAHTYSIMNAREPLIGAFDGIELAAHGEVFAGDESWTRVSLVERAGKNVGRFHLRQSLAVMNGSALDIVNRFVVGGSWDALGGTAVYGLRYGELRVERAIIASGGADIRLPRQWRAGIRGSWIDADNGSTHGHAINVSKIWKTIGANFGVGRSADDDVTFYGALIVPLYQK